MSSWLELAAPMLLYVVLWAVAAWIAWRRDLGPVAIASFVGMAVFCLAGPPLWYLRLEVLPVLHIPVWYEILDLVRDVVGFASRIGLLVAAVVGRPERETR